MLTVALDRVDFLAPDRVTDNAAILTLKSLVFEPLCRWRDGMVLPGLFARWGHDGSGRRWRFAIRDGARFHDGKPCTAGDILAFIAAILDSRDMFGMRWSYARYFAGVRMSAAAPDVVAFETPLPFGDLPEILTEFHIARIDPAGRAVIGTGPMRVGAFTGGGEAILLPASGAGRRIHAMAVPDAGDRLARVRAGEVDVACGLEQCAAPPALDPLLGWASALNTLSVMFYLNCAEGAFVQAEARLAANLAVDKALIVREQFGGQAGIAATVVSPAHFGFRAAGIAPIPYDPDAARRLMDGVGGDRALRLRTPDHMPERAPAISAIVAASLTAIGFDVTVDLQPDRPEYAREIGAKRMGDLAAFDSSPHSTFRVLDDKISARVRGIWWQGYDDPEAEALIAAARATIDDGQRASAYGRCLARLNRAPPWLYVLHPRVIAASRPGIPAVSIDSKGVVDFGRALDQSGSRPT